MAIQITDNSSDLNGVAVTTAHELKTTLTQEADESGFASCVSEKGILPDGTRVMKELEVSNDYRLRVETDNILFSDFPIGTALNSSILSTLVSSSQTVVVGSNRYELNSSGLATVNSGSLIRTCRTFPWYKANAQYVECALAWTLEPCANWFAEWGLIATTTAIAAITDGCFFRITAGSFRGVMVNGSIPTEVDLGALPSFGDVHNCVIEICQDIVYFWVDNDLRATLAVPATMFSSYGQSQLPFVARTYNGAVIPATAIKVQLSAIQVSNGGADFNRLWPTTQAGMGGGCYQVPGGAAAGQTANWTNSAAVVAIAVGSLSNTAASFAALGGQWFIGAPATADTDYHIMSYLVPVGKTLIIRGVRIETANLGAVVATTGHLLQWGLAVGATANTLAGTETLLGVKIRRIIPLGMQSFAVGAAIGATAAPIDVNLDSPIIVHSGEYAGFALKVLVGTATASQTLRGIIQVNGYFE